jgi:hypothetical protein
MSGSAVERVAEVTARARRDGRQRGCARGQMQKLPSVGKFHFEPPSRFTSLDHLVGPREHGWRHVKAERFRRLEVDHQLVLGWRLYRQVGRPLALEDAVDIGRCAVVLILCSAGSPSRG